MWEGEQRSQWAAAAEVDCKKCWDPSPKPASWSFSISSVQGGPTQSDLCVTEESEERNSGS